MNWYALLKFAQIWNVNSENSSGSFSDDIYRLYELEYKYSMVKNKPFVGLPQRRENILINLERELKIVINNIMTPIKSVFKDWLEHHDFVVDKNEQFIYPRWWDEFLDKGIVKIRANIESIYNYLTSAQNIENAITAISLAKNAIHVTGSMMNYLEEEVGEYELAEVFEDASNINTLEWDQQLFSIGIRMDNVNPIVEIEQNIVNV